ncbi:MAG: SpoIIE family protein phosphatase [Bacteroidales bacterium]|nr:SpoIIE family protein phosphatase [Bacteroidales bacterium]
MLRNIKLKISIVLLLFVTINSINAQNFNKYRGLPFIRNFTPEEYNAHEQNFDIVQDTSGIMYFANFSGILQYDGTKWIKTTTKSGMRVLSLDVDLNGRVYAGGLEDFGYIEHLKNGTNSYVSLANNSEEEIGMIFEVLCNKDAVYFIAAETMYVYKDSTVSKVKFESKVKSAFLMGNNPEKNLYLFFEKDFKNKNKIQNGLVLYKNGSFQSVKDNSESQIVDVQTMFNNVDEESFVLGTATQGMFLLRNNTITEFEIPINDFLKKQGHTCGSKISETNYALGTHTGGIIISDDKGRSVQIIDKNSSLQDETINALYTDRYNSLWVATDNGISKIEVNWNLSYIDNISSGLEGKVQDIVDFNEKTFFATDNGLFFIKNNKVEKVNGINFACWDIEVVNNIMLLATTRGIYTVEDNNAVPSEYKDFSFCLSKSEYDNNVIYSGHNGRIDLYNLKNNKLKKQSSIKTIEGDVYKISDTKEGDLFAEVSPGKIFRYSFINGNGSEIKTEQHLISLHIQKKAEDIFFTSEKGLYKYENNNLGKYLLFPEDTSSYRLWIHDLYEISNEKYIITDGEQKNIAFYEKNDKSYKITQTPFLPIANFTVNTIHYSPETSIVWLGGKNGLILYNNKQAAVYDNNFSTLIRTVKSLNADSLLGFKSVDYTKLEYSDNSLRFDFSAPVYVSKGKTLYRYFLKGFDKDSSDWTELTYKDYTNIPAGKYSFTVEAKNEFGKNLNKSSFDFEILIPMYRRWWAFIIYALLLFGIIRLYMNWRMKAVEKERKVLEDTVKERTEEIEESKEEIESQRDVLYKQKKEIIDSINYAERIQSAVLPSAELMNDVVKDHFVFFKPRDIVSGDFYWVKKIRTFSFIVAADCTGHGVPGAFMSMLGSSFLNEIVTSRTLDSAGEVLNRLRNKVKKSLHQKGAEGEQKDGMDISLLIIDWETLELQFAGAYNSLYIVRKNGEQTNEEANYEFIKLKADRQPIGIYIHEKDFTNHSFQLQKGDTIYALSDGYVDQFGGDTGGKFKSGRFQKLLLSFQDKSMEEQKHILGRTFTKWKRDIEQIDDVLIIGMRI